MLLFLYPAKICRVEASEKKALIHFEGWNHRFDEWIVFDSERIRASSHTVEPKEEKVDKHPHPQEWKIGDRILAKWIDGKFYPARVTRKNDDGMFEVLFYDGFKKNVHRSNLKPDNRKIQTLPVSKDRLHEQSERMQRKTKLANARAERAQKRNKEPIKVIKKREIAEKHRLEYVSEVALAATLNQNGRPVAFFSHNLQGSELKHASIEKEAQAIIELVRHWKHFLMGRHFTLKTDQKSVSYMVDQHRKGKIKNDKIMRSQLELSCYSFDIIYRLGKDNIPPDTLSRATCAAAADDALYKLHESLSHPGGYVMYPPGHGPTYDTRPPMAWKPHHIMVPGYPMVMAFLIHLNIVPYQQNMKNYGDMPRKGKETAAPAPKELVIDLDHNKFKCPIQGCDKSFRKESGLDYHMKYYHSPGGNDVKRKRSSGSCFDIWW
ncbi:hypothetical protein QZH41_009632 [Actinostola sp. cb2023]|nr:hypothetical protein QZH41_009632 [Actinostola sp. cb2023]